MLAVGSVVLAGLGATSAVAAQASTASVVTGHSGWYTQAYENFETGGYLTPQQADVAGPQRAPFGSGSHKVTIGESSAQTELYRTDAYDGVLVSDLTRLEYSTLARRVSGTGDRQPTCTHGRFERLGSARRRTSRVTGGTSPSPDIR